MRFHSTVTDRVHAILGCRRKENTKRAFSPCFSRLWCSFWMVQRMKVQAHANTTSGMQSAAQHLPRNENSSHAACWAALRWLRGALCVADSIGTFCSAENIPYASCMLPSTVTSELSTSVTTNVSPTSHTCTCNYHACTVVSHVL